jgi:hypothetical protein
VPKRYSGLTSDEEKQKKVKSRHALEIEAPAGQAPSVDGAGGLSITADNHSIQSQISLLGDTRFRAVQRQAIAAQVGQVGGNQYLQNVLGQMIQRKPKHKAKSTVKPKAKHKTKAKAKAKPPEDPSVKLRTGLDSKVTVSAEENNTYAVNLSLEGTEELQLVARYQITAESASLRDLPVYIEDIVTPSQALVRIQYDPDVATVKIIVADKMFGNQRVRVEAISTPAKQLHAAAAPKAKDVGPGYVAEGSENVTSHSSGSDVDKVMSSIVSSEGGFASTEGSDLGIFTWGQGQWTVGANLLQPVMQFIKDKRPDLFTRYWGAAGLDVKDNVFYYNGKKYKGKKKLKNLFRSSKEKNLAWVNIFAQAGQDPQIQRLQREYERGEVQENLSKTIGGKSPDDWLDTRGKAMYYSMWVNLPNIAQSYFKKACKKAGKATTPTDEIKHAISKELEDQFEQSGVTARSGDKHHYIAFWGESGRNLAIEEANNHIADPTLDTQWTTKQWQKQLDSMTKRDSRYQKTKADIDKALAKQDVEPDIPAELKNEFTP